MDKIRLVRQKHIDEYESRFEQAAIEAEELANALYSVWLIAGLPVYGPIADRIRIALDKVPRLRKYDDMYTALRSQERHE